MPVQKASDLSSQSGSVQQLTHGAGIVEEFPLQLCGQGNATLAEEEEHILRCLGAALIMQWNRRLDPAPKREGCFGNYSLAIARYPRAR